MEAALLDRESDFPRWPAGLVPDSEEDLDQINAWIHESYRDQPWSRVHRDWQEGFLRFLELAEAIPEADLLEVGRYPWLKEHPLSLILVSSYEHHHEEHLQPLLAWLRRPNGPPAHAATFTHNHPLIRFYPLPNSFHSSNPRSTPAIAPAAGELIAS